MKMTIIVYVLSLASSNATAQQGAQDSYSSGAGLSHKTLKTVRTDAVPKAAKEAEKALGQASNRHPASKDTPTQRRSHKFSLFGKETKKFEVNVESIVPLYFTKGYHVALGFRYKFFRVRTSVIYGGTYDAERSGINDSADSFKRHYDYGGWGFFFGFFPFTQRWLDGFHVYVFFEHHRWKIVNKANDQTAKLDSFDMGPGIGYQLVMFNYFYLQPAFHFYMRKGQTTLVGGQPYSLPRFDCTAVLRLGIRLPF